MDRPTVDEDYNEDHVKIQWEKEMRVSFSAHVSMLLFVIPLDKDMVI